MVAMNILSTLAVFFGLYCVGAIPTGYLLCKYFYGIDVTTMGSGNIGATNVARVLGDIRFFFLIFFIDAAKAFLALKIACMPLEYWYGIVGGNNLLLLGAAAVFLGNAHSIFLRFKGGKGVATLIGLVLYLLPWWLMGIFLVVWIFILGVTRVMYLASLSGAFVMVLAYWISYFYPTNLMAYFLAILFCFLVARHKRNILDALHRS